MQNLSSTKTCRDCSRDLPLDQFHKNAETKDRLYPKCRDCVKVYRRAYYLKHQERLQRYSKQFYVENTENVKAYVKQHQKKNKFKNQERYKKWRAANREKLLADKKLNYQKNKERYSMLSREYQKKHPEYNKVSTLRRRALLRSASGSCSGQQWIAKCEYHGWRCYLCQTSLTIKTVHMDHRKPLAKNGSNWPANLAPACGPCNLSKSHKTEKEYKERIR